MQAIKRLSPSALILLGSNLIALASALLFHWSALDIFLSYWIQSLFIGIFQRRKIIDMHEYRRAASGKKWVVISGTRIFRKDGDAGFSKIYGAFWVGVGIALFFSATRAENLTISPLDVLFQSGVFFLSHWWSYCSNKKNDERREPDILINSGLPLLRVFLPLFLVSSVIDFGKTYAPAVVVAWMLLKTVVDVGSHLIEHDKNRVKFG